MTIATAAVDDALAAAEQHLETARQFEAAAAATLARSRAELAALADRRTRLINTVDPTASSRPAIELKTRYRAARDVADGHNAALAAARRVVAAAELAVQAARTEQARLEAARDSAPAQPAPVVGPTEVAAAIRAFERSLVDLAEAEATRAGEEILANIRTASQRARHVAAKTLHESKLGLVRLGGTVYRDATVTTHTPTMTTIEDGCFRRRPAYTDVAYAVEVVVPHDLSHC